MLTPQDYWQIKINECDQYIAIHRKQITHLETLIKKENGHIEDILKQKNHFHNNKQHPLLSIFSNFANVLIELIKSYCDASFCHNCNKMYHKETYCLCRMIILKHSIKLRVCLPLLKEQKMNINAFFEAAKLDKPLYEYLIQELIYNRYIISYVAFHNFPFHTQGNPTYTLSPTYNTCMLTIREYKKSSSSMPVYYYNAYHFQLRFEQTDFLIYNFTMEPKNMVKLKPNNPFQGKRKRILDVII